MTPAPGQPQDRARQPTGPRAATSSTSSNTNPPIDQPGISALDRPRFTASGPTVLRNGTPIAHTETDDLARAIALIFDDCQLLFGPDVPIADQEFVKRTIWPELRELTREPDPDAEFIGTNWED